MGFGFGKSMFDDDFFKSAGFGGGGGFSSKFGFDDEPPTRGTGFGLTKSVSTTTKTINGQTTVTKKTTIFK